MVDEIFSFPSEGFVMQSFTIKWTTEANSPETVLPPLIKTGVAGTGDNIHVAF